MDSLNKSRRDFGSFHSSNVEELINLDDQSYSKPDLKFDFSNDESFKDLLKMNLSQRFGTKTLKEALFHLNEDEFVFLNHGAFGVCFKQTLNYVHKWSQYAEEQPLRFYDRQILPILVDILRLYAKNVFYCKPNELVLIENCTFAFNSILNSMTLNENNHILVFNTIYGCYRKMLKAKCDETSSKLIEMEIEFPIKNESDMSEHLVKKFFYKYLSPSDENSKIKYFFVDLIPSNCSFQLPIKEIIDMCKSLRPDIICIVDAAHGLGSVRKFSFQFDGVLTKNIDFMFTNCHKWLCGPKGTGFLFKNCLFDASHPSRDLLRLKPAVQSHGIASGFQSEFIWTGLKEYSAFIGLYSTYFIWQECFKGFDLAISYCTLLTREAARYLVQEFKTECLVNENLCSTMVCVQLPDKFVRNVLIKKHESDIELDNVDFLNELLSNENKLSYDYSHAEIIQNFLYFKYNIEIPCKSIKSNLYLRLSAHVYNKFDDYKYLYQAIANHNN